jgi:uncharacterized membrane protein YfcA
MNEMANVNICDVSVYQPFVMASKFHSHWIIICIGMIAGFLSGLLGKGGSAITTPALQIFASLNPFAALASPLPATLPTTLAASFAYSKKKLIHKKVASASIILGIPATLLGSWGSEWIGGQALMILTAIFVLSLGISFLFHTQPALVNEDEIIPTRKIALVAIPVGLLSGLLANSGGVLFGPLFIRYLKMPVKQAFATSLIVSAGLAIPGTIAHWQLGHINWIVVILLSASSVPFSYLGARLALSLKNLEYLIFGTATN